MDRREFLKAAAAGVLATAAVARAGNGTGGAARPRVAVVGGGYGGATAAKYLRLLDPSLDVVLVEPHQAFVSCPMSNLVLGGFLTMADITTPYAGLERRGIRVVRDRATAVDADRKQVRLARGDAIAFDRVIVAPGIDFMWGAFPAMATDEARARLLHAWKAGAQTLALRRQLEAMPDGGTFLISIPEAPYRCPPGPYERACQVAAYFKRSKPRAKVLILDANPDITSKAALFRKAWADLYPGIVEYRPNSRAVDLDVAANSVRLDSGAETASVINVLPPMQAAGIVAPFITANGRWCEVDWLTYESTAARGVHILGDSLQNAPLMPKSAGMANGHGKVCAAAVAALLRDEAPNPFPALVDTCFSMVSDNLAIHDASVHRYEPGGKGTMKAVPGAGGVSSAMNGAAAHYALNWARNIRADALA